jgi:kinesin family protein C2/C3
MAGPDPHLLTVPWCVRSGDRLLEAQHINKSLSALGDVMSALASKNNHVPFRNSKLTQLLQDSLSGQAKVMMFMHVAPECSSFGESLSTLKFGLRVSEITLGQVRRRPGLCECGRQCHVNGRLGV